MKRYLLILLLFILLLVLAWNALLWTRPSRVDQQRLLFQGVTYERDARSIPRPLMVHVVTIDLTAPGISPLVTPGQAGDEMDSSARTASEFLTEFNLQLAVNGSFFHPFYENVPWDYYPHGGDPVDVHGLAISNGVAYSTGRPTQPVLCLSATNHAQISEAGCAADTLQALAGGPLLVEHGRPVALGTIGHYAQLHPRTAVAVSEDGETLWLIVVDGKQPGYSEGITLSELADMAIELGADRALNLDGGGSTTLVMAGKQGPRLLNAPIHTRVPMRERPVANHLGIYALPVDTAELLSQ